MEEIAQALAVEIRAKVPVAQTWATEDNNFWTVYVVGVGECLECIFGREDQPDYAGRLYVYYNRNLANIFWLGDPGWIDALLKQVEMIPWKSA